MSPSGLRIVAVRWLLVATALTSSFWFAALARADFCDTSVVHDYTRFLRDLPRLPSRPSDEHLDFAPARVFLGHQGFGPLQLGAGRRGYSLAFGPYSEGNPASRRVNWQVTSQLVRIDRQGRPLSLPRIIKKHVKRVPAGNGLDFGFDVDGKPAVYRLEIVFEDGRGQRLARYGEYFRVMRPSLDVDFILNGTAFHRGETVQASLVNRGAAFLRFGLEKSIQYNEGGSWVAPPVKFPGGIVPAIGLGIGPGQKTTCWGADIPVDAALGTYRFGKRIDYVTGPFGRPRPFEVGAEFTVVE